MDQVKIGAFIQALRKEKKLTQREVAEQLAISDKTVSKWETGHGMPEISLMLPLCNILGISVNELLSAEKLDETQYHQKAEENMMSLMEERKEAKKKIILSAVMAAIMLFAIIPLVLLAALLELTPLVRGILIGTAVLIVVLSIGVACVLDRDAGTYECKHCGTRFVPGMMQYIMAPHTITTRRLKCPNCGKKSYCKKRLTK